LRSRNIVFITLWLWAGIANAGLVGLWRLDEGTGTTANDHAGTNHGTLVGGTSWTTGRLGSAVTFNGTTGRINISAAVQTTEPMSLCGWFNTGSTTGVQPVLTIQAATNSNMLRLILYQSKVQGQTQTGGSSALAASTDNYPLSVWAHGCVIFSSTTLRYVYLNNVKGPDNTTSRTLPTGLTTTYIGGTVSTDEFMNGSLDEIRVYSHALSAGEIARLYIRGRAAR
jgi:hypothetical protein